LIAISIFFILFCLWSNTFTLAVYR
jgi:hypothetical protein